MGLGVETNTAGGWRVVHDGRELAVGRINAYKPYIHPLNTLAGDCLTVDAPWDHTWHRGLYFAWKYLAGANAWGEGDEEPVRRSARARVASERAAAADGRVQIDYEIAWEALEPVEPLLSEVRTLRFWLPDGAPGYYGIDWSARFTAQTRVELERSTPVDAKRGGYAGLSWRPARALHAGRTQIFNAAGGEGVDGVQGRPAEWAAFFGRVDGAPRPGRGGGLVIMAHPESFRHPAPIFVRAQPHYGFLQAAPIFLEPYTLASGETLVLRYRLLVCGRALEPGEIAAAYRAWVG